MSDRAPAVVRGVVIGLLAVVMSWAPATATADEVDARLATSWFEFYLTLVRETPGFSPPVAARAFAYAGLTLYESLVDAIPGYETYGGRLPDLPPLPRPHAGGVHPPAVANAALAAIARELFVNARSTNVMALDRLEAEWSEVHAQEVDSGTLARSHRHGVALAEALHAWAERDGGHLGQLSNFDPAYQPPDGPGHWVPTPRAVGEPLPAVQPWWGENRPFAPSIHSACEPPPPPAYDELPDSQLYREALEVMATVRAITPHQRETAQFWSDDGGSTATPAGHWTSILTHVIDVRNDSLAFAAVAYSTLGMALSDAFVRCWRTKFRHAYLRPITYIQRVIDPTWNHPSLTDPLLTPPFPEYTSGHSVVSSAAATVLTALVGDDVAFVDHFHAPRGFQARTYDSFWAAAEEAALSRLLGGVHFRSAIEHGLAEGRCVGAQILALAGIDMK